MRVALADKNSNPLYPAANETIISLMSQAAAAKEERAVGVAPDTDYELAVKVKRYSKTWFVEVKVKATYSDGTSMGY